MLDDRAIYFRILVPGRSGLSSFPPVGAQAACCPMNTGAISPRGKQSGRQSNKIQSYNTARYEKLVLNLHFSIRRF